VVAVNEALDDTPEIVNSEPYHEGWLIRIKPSDDADLSELLDADAYAELVESEDH
ncbi:MAG: glycine cleavage system protein H, partial [Gammaproteobacteria bacterium]|nr:glycine cleavage system protein H [Gammaproteobacteria bacterium]